MNNDDPLASASVSPRFSFIRLLFGLLVIGLLAVVILSQFSLIHQLRTNEKTLSGICEKVAELQTVDHASPPAEPSKVKELLPSPATEFDSNEWEISLLELEERFQELGGKPSSVDLASLLAEADSWVFATAEAEKATALLDKNMDLLRGQILLESKALQTRALKEPSGTEADRAYGEASQLISLFPVGTSTLSAEQARQLIATHQEVGTKVQVKKRVRYNRWAVDRIESALAGYHDSSKFWSPKKENPDLIDSLVKYLSEVDTAHLEPTVLSLYTYVVDLTRESISEKDQINLAKRLMASDVTRKTPNDILP